MKRTVVILFCLLFVSITGLNAAPAKAFERIDIQFTSGGLKCAGWFYRAAGDDKKPCIILAHGFSGLKEFRLDAYAEKFASAGYHALVFDYRYFGGSEGEPRRILDIDKQLEDWHAAIAYARTLDCVDPDRIVLWGTSFSGGHVVKVAVKDGRIVAVISQVPHMDGFATVRMSGFRNGMRLSWAGWKDTFRSWFGKSPYYVPAAGRPGELAAMTAPGVAEGIKKLYPAGWNQADQGIAARIFLKMSFYSPGKYAKKMTMPWLVQVADYDNTTPVEPAVKAAGKAPRAHLVRYKCGHFDMYVEPLFKEVVGEQLRFLKENVK